MRTFDISGRSRRPCPTATPCPSSPPSRAADRPGAGPRSQAPRAAPAFGPGSGPFGACAALGAHVALTRPDGEGTGRDRTVTFRRWRRRGRSVALVGLLAVPLAMPSLAQETQPAKLSVADSR